MTATSVYHNNETGIFLFSRQDGENNGFLAGVSPPPPEEGTPYMKGVGMLVVSLSAVISDFGLA